MVCALTDKQQRTLLRKVVKDLLLLAEEGKPFDLKNYIFSIYSTVNEATKNEALALTYAGLVPSQIMIGRVFHRELRDYIPNSNALEEVEKTLSTFENIPIYLGITGAAPEPIRVTTPPPPEEEEDSEPLLITVPEFSARPNNMFTTTGNEEDPDMAFSYNFIRFLTRKLTSVASRDTGFYLSTARPEDVLRPEDTSNPEMFKGIIHIITDVDGNVVYFDGNYDVTTAEKGKPVFFNVREKESTLQTVQERAKTLGVSTELAERITRAQILDIRKKKSWLLSNPGQKIINEITMASNGYLPRVFGKMRPLKDAADLSGTSLKVEKTRGEFGQETNFIISDYDQPITVSLPYLEDMGEFLDDFVDILLNSDNVVTEAGEKNDFLISIRQAMLKEFAGNNAVLKIDNTGQLRTSDGPVLTKEELLPLLTRYKDPKGNWQKSKLNVTQKYEDGMPFYEKRNGKIYVSLDKMTGAQYKKFIQQYSSTPYQYDENGEFKAMHPYFSFSTPLTESQKYADTTAEEFEIDDEGLPTAIEKKEDKKFVKKDIAPPIKQNIDELKKKLNSFDVQRNLDRNLTDEDLDKAKKWYESHPMSKFVPFAQMFNIVNTEDPRIIAQWTEAGITLYKGSDYSDLYHEAFHAFTQLFVLPEQRTRLYNAVRSLKGSFTDYEGKSVEFSKASDLQAEEYLAEDFRRYMLSGKSKVSNKEVKSFFKWLLDFLKAFFNLESENYIETFQNSVAIQEVYNNLRYGNINSLPYNYDNRAFDKLNKFQGITPESNEDLRNLSYSQAMMLVDSIDSLFSEFTDDLDTLFPTEKHTSRVVSTVNNRVVAYNYVYNKFKEKYNELAEKITKLDPASKEYEKLYNSIQVLEKAILNFSPSVATQDKITEEDITSAIDDPRGLIAYHMQKSKYLSFEDKYEIQEEENERQKDKDGYSHRSGNELSAKDLASKEVLYLIRSLFEYKNGKVVLNDLGFPKLQSFDVTWNKLQKALDGTTKATRMYAIMLEKAKSDLSFAQLVQKLGPPTIINGTKPRMAQLNLWTQINQTFSFKRVPLIQVTVDLVGEGGVNVKVGAAQAEVNQIKRAWDAAFTDPANPNKYVVKLEASDKALGKNKTGGSYLNLNKVIQDFKDGRFEREPIAFLRAMGMDVTDHPTILKDLKSGNLRLFTRTLYQKLVHFRENKIFVNKPSDVVDKKGPDGANHSTLYKDLLKLEARFSEKYGSAMVSNAKGDPQYEYTLRSTVSEMISAINRVNSYADLIKIPEMAHLDVARNPFAKDLIILTRIFGEDYWMEGKGLKLAQYLVGGAKKTPKLELLNSSGVALTREGEFHMLGISSNEADEVTQILQNFYTLLKYGVAESTRHADKSTTYLYRLVSLNKSHYIDLNAFANYKNRRGTIAEQARDSAGAIAFKEQLFKYLNAEIQRMVKLRNGDVSGTALVGDKTYQNVGSHFVQFDDILTPKTKLLLEEKDFIATDFMEKIESDVTVRQAVENDILDYFESQVEGFKEDMNEYGIFDNVKLMDNVRNLITINNTSREVVDDALARAYVANDWIHKYETTSLLYGDAALYNHLKEEFHKRNAGLAATGTIPRTDSAMINLLNDTVMKGRYADSAFYNQSGYSLSPYAREKKWGNTFRTAILQDAKVESPLVDDYIKAFEDSEKERLGRDLTPEELEQIQNAFSEYRGMKTGDGQGWITFDAYRGLLITLGKWTDYQEDMYNAILSGKNISVADVSQFFPVKKLQYWGPLKSEGLPLIGFHKFSLMPLIPTVVKGTKLEILHNKMVSQGIDYATFLSGSKVNTITKNGRADKFYEYSNLKAGEEPDLNVSFEADDYEFTPNDIFLNYLKDQIEINDHYKGQVIFSTQLRKLIEEGLIANGVPTDYSGTRDEWQALSESEKINSSVNYRKIINYESLVREFTDYKIAELMHEADIKFDGDKFILSEKLIDFVRKELTRQDLADHEIDFIKYDHTQKRLVYDLSIHPSAQKIEGLLSAIIYKRVIRQKANGEALIQVSGTGFESVNLRKPTLEEQKRYGLFNLPFYQRDLDRSGKPQKTRAMKVKIALQGDFKKLLRHPDVVALTRANKSLTALDALNRLIKDEGWLNLGSNRAFVTITGVRIPVQGTNSMEFAEVYEFLPENSGNMIILPAEMVAKSGSDFDIDKLTLLFPSILKTSKGVSLIRYNKSKVDFDKTLVLKNRLKELYSELSKAHEDVSEFTKNFLDTTPFDLKNDLVEIIKGYKAEIKRINFEIWDRLEKDDIYPEALYDELYDIQEELVDIYKLAAKDVIEYRDSKIGPIMEEIDAVKTEMAETSSKGIENALLTSVVDILSDPATFTSLVTPNGTFLLKGLADDLAEFAREYDPFERISSEKTGKTISPTRIFELRYNRYKQGSNNIGKKTLGLGAVDNTYNSIFNRVGAYMNSSLILGKGKNQYEVKQRLLLPHNKMIVNGEEVISISNLYDVENKNRISTVISQMLNGWLDVAKDSWIFDIQGNSEVAPTLLFLVQAGVPVETAIYFVSQPLVREYVKLQRSSRGTFAKPLGIPGANTNQFRVLARRKIFSKFVSNPTQITDYNQSKLFYTEMVKQYLWPFDAQDEKFELNDLKANIEAFKNTGEYTNFDFQAFVHFIEVEEMAKALTKVKMGVNFDTSRLNTIYSIEQKLSKYEDLFSEKRIPGDLIDSIETDSPIGSFKQHDKILAMLKNLFPTRASEQLTKFINDEYGSMSDSDMQKKFGSSFLTKEALVNSFRNDFTNYILQQFLYNTSTFDPTKPYRAANVERSVFEVETVKILKRGAFVDKGVLYVDIPNLRKQFENKTYEKQVYMESYQHAPIPSSYFSNMDPDIAFKDYVKFIYERETLRYLTPFEDYSKTEDYKVRLAELNKRSDSIKGIKLERLAYEEYLRDTALLNKYNLNYLFFNPQGYAYRIGQILQSYPELKLNQFSILQSLQPVYKNGVFNLRFSEIRLESDTINAYHEQLLLLSNPNVKKVDNELDNQIISNLFMKFPLFAFMQTGHDGKNEFSLSRIIDTSRYAKLLDNAINWTLKNKMNGDANTERFLEDYNTAFLNNYGTPTSDPNDIEDGEYKFLRRQKIKKYYTNYRRKYIKNAFTIKAPYDQNVNLFNFNVLPPVRFKKIEVDKRGRDVPMLKDNTALFVKSFLEAVKNQKLEDAFFVINNSSTAFDNTMNPSGIGDSINATVFKDLQAQGKLPQMFKGVTTKTKSFLISADEAWTDKTYSSNVATIEKGIQNLMRLRDEGKTLIFDSNGYGQTLIGYIRDEKTKDKKSKQIPAPKTFLYLTKRLYDEFGYINPRYDELISNIAVDEGIKAEAREITQQITKPQPITDALVREKLNECFKSLLDL